MPNSLSIAITGMNVSFQGCEGLDAFEQVIYTPHAGQRKGQNGHSTTEGGAARLARVAVAALQDASLDTDRFLKSRAVIFTAGSELPDGLAGGSARLIDLSGHPHPLAAAVEQSERLFASQEADVVLFAALGTWKETSPDTAYQVTDAMGFDREVHSWRLGEGAAAVVWMPFEQAQQAGQRVYAVLRGHAVVPGSAEMQSLLPVPLSLPEARGCIQSALQLAGVLPEQVGYVEAFASGYDRLDGVEIAALAQAYHPAEPDLTTAVGSVQASFGYLGHAAGLGGLIRTALCLYHRFIPAVSGWSAPKLPALWRGSIFYAPAESRPWFLPAGGLGRLAGVTSIGLGGSMAHFILEESEPQSLHPNQALQQSGIYLIPVASHDLSGLLEGLKDLREALSIQTNLAELASIWHAQAAERTDALFAAALLGHDPDELRREVDMAIKSIPAAYEKGEEWQTPLGSCFTPQPVGPTGQVALVYPGAFNAYPGVGQHLFRLFPWLYQKSVARTRDLGRVIRDRLLYPRSLTALSQEELAGWEASLLADPIAMLTSGSTLAVLFTYILKEAFQIHPAAAFGYSLGENSMLFANGVWQEGDAVAGALETSDLFRSRLAGPQNAVRQYWGLPSGDTVQEVPLWSNYLLMAQPDRVAQAVAGEQRVYITHINAPRQVVIGGDPAACERVIAALRCSSLQAPFDYALHCEAIASEIGSLTALHDWPVEAQPGLRLYTAAHYGPMKLERHAIARQIGQMLTSPLDFPRLVRRVYADGARVFIEVGAGSNCARWISETLKGQPHLALSLNRRGTDDASNLVRSLARLFSHRVPLDLTPLYQSKLEKVSL